MHFFITISLLLSAVTSVVSGHMGKVTFINHCRDTIYIWQSNDIDCNRGRNGYCYEEFGRAEPWTIRPHQNTSLDWVANDKGSSVKIQRVRAMGLANIQFEYTVKTAVQQNFWDLSNIDGAGPSLAGTPFAGDNVLITPEVTKSIDAFPTCALIFCKANEICTDAYQYPSQKATKVCPSLGMGVTVDLCLPDDSPRIPKNPSNKHLIRFVA